MKGCFVMNVSKIAHCDLKVLERSLRHPMTKEGEAYRGILYPKYLEMETFFLTLEHILRLQKKNFFWL